MNGHPLTAEHGAPLRLVVPGYPASASGKWLKRLWIRNKVHDGEKMNGDSYRIPPYPVRAGTDVPIDDSWKIIKRMPVKALIHSPRCHSKFEQRKVLVQGFAWTSAERVVAVDVSYDFGQTWFHANLYEGANRYAWQKWELELELPGKGYYEIWARATDSDGKMQPMVVGNWNPKGYLNNAMPRISVTVG